MSEKKFEVIYSGVRDLHSTASSLHGRILTQNFYDPDNRIKRGFELTLEYLASCGEWLEKDIRPRSSEVSIDLFDMMKERLADARTVMLAASQFKMDHVEATVDRVHEAASTLNSMFAEVRSRQPTFPDPPDFARLPGKPRTQDDDE